MEQGRALRWSVSFLPRSIAQLIEEDSPLAKKFAEFNQELHALAMSGTPNGRGQMEDGVAQSRDLTVPFGRLVVEERDALIHRSKLEGF